MVRCGHFARTDMPLDRELSRDFNITLMLKCPQLSPVGRSGCPERGMRRQAAGWREQAHAVRWSAIWIHTFVNVDSSPIFIHMYTTRTRGQFQLKNREKS